MDPVRTDSRLRGGEHVVLFYRTDAELVEKAGDYLADGLGHDHIAIVLATPDHRVAIEATLAARGVDVAAARNDQTLIVLDAADVLATLVDGDHIDRDSFDGLVAQFRQLATTTGRYLRVYADTSAVLWRDGNVAAAIDLEACADGIGAEWMSIFCAYPLESMSGGHARSVARVCQCHSAVLSSGFPPDATRDS